MDANDIAQSLADALATVEEVDIAATESFLPALETQAICALLVPFEQESVYEQQDLAGEQMYARHVMKVEFWCKHDPGQAGETLRKARDIGRKGMTALVQHDGEGYTLDRNEGFRERVDSGFVTVANIAWLVAHLYVPLENEVTL